MASDSPFTIIQETPEEPQGCGCSGANCGAPPPVSRRQFLKLGTAAGASVLFGSSGISRAAQPAGSGQVRNAATHLIPADKNLPAGWLRSLWEQGEKAWWSGTQLRTIGMPVCGIGTGQLYLCGDGTLGQWEIFNHHRFIGYGAQNYEPRTIPKPVRHGFAVWTEQDGKPTIRQLNESGFADVKFRGEYPIGQVTYEDPETPLSVMLEAFSPFVPLNAPDSALPVTVMNITVRNHGSSAVSFGLLSWLENPIARNAGERGWKGRRITRLVKGAEASRLEYSAEASPEEDTTPEPRVPMIFADFESGSFGDWEVRGEAFGSAPVAVEQRLPKQQKVEGAQGTAYINSFHGEDRTTGRLLSPEFTINRRFINFLLAGGNKADLVGIRLLISNEPVRSATGGESEHLKWNYWDVQEYEGQRARIELFDESTDSWGHVLADQIEFSDEPRADDQFKDLQSFPDYGTITYSITAPVADVPAGVRQALPADLQEQITWGATAESSLTERNAMALATRQALLEPGEERSFSFILAWHFPNTVKPDREVGHEYAARFQDSGAVSDYVIQNLERLTTDTRKWRDTWYDSTLPYWLLDRVHLTADCLATGTTQWWKNGRFWAYEGVVCCIGTCTHVWNYAQSLAFLFPELERNVRERQDLGVGLEPNGLVGFRHNGEYAADGQAGTVLKIWREHRLSSDDGFLRRNWEKTKKVINFLLEQDGNADGLIENRQHNTYDIDFYGANTFVGALYLGALRAGEEMAREMGDTEYADRLRKVYESGRRQTEERLWNGEYFIQDVDLAKHPTAQYATGCLSDQMFGQNWAHLTGLGYLYDPEKVKSALRSVWKYNWAPDTGRYNERFPPERPYTDATEPGLFICTWPGSKHLDEGVRYRDEVWTGIEYQVASHMIMEDQLEEGLAICRAVHDRYSPERRNPYNEVECSDFYARAMASWGVLLGLSGYQHHGPKGYMAFAPRFKPESFRCAFTASDGWGTFSQESAEGKGAWNVHVRHGKLRLTQLQVTGPKPLSGTVEVVADGNTPAGVETKIDGAAVIVTFAEPLVLEEDGRLEVRVV